MSEAEFGEALASQRHSGNGRSATERLASRPQAHQSPVSPGVPAAAVRPVELRVHGVSGTPPEQMLVAPPYITRPAVRQVAGDAAAGFYVQDGPDPLPIEAYSWGGLTSGGKLRALWLLLVPFMLVNLAFWTASAQLGVSKGPPRTRTARRVLEAALRLFALSLTAAFVLAFVVASMDIVGWQYVQQAGGQATVPWLSFLTWGPLNHPNIQLLLTALVPLALVLLLWYLGRSTWQRLESTSSPIPAGDSGPLSPLEDRAMWNGQRPVGHLRALHFSFALAMLGLFLVMPLLMDPAAGGFAGWSATWQRPWGPAALLVAGGLAVFGLVAIVATCLPSLSDRKDVDRKQSQKTKDKYPLWLALEVVVGFLLVAAAALLLFPGPWQAVWQRPGGRTIGSLPGSVVSVQTLFVAQGVLAMVIFAFAGLLHVLARKPSAATGVMES